MTTSSTPVDRREAVEVVALGAPRPAVASRLRNRRRQRDLGARARLHRRRGVGTSEARRAASGAASSVGRWSPPGAAVVVGARSTAHRRREARPRGLRFSLPTFGFRAAGSASAATLHRGARDGGGRVPIAEARGVRRRSCRRVSAGGVIAGAATGPSRRLVSVGGRGAAAARGDRRSRTAPPSREGGSAPAASPARGRRARPRSGARAPQRRATLTPRRRPPTRLAEDLARLADSSDERRSTPAADGGADRRRSALTAPRIGRPRRRLAAATARTWLRRRGGELGARRSDVLDGRPTPPCVERSGEHAVP